MRNEKIAIPIKIETDIPINNLPIDRMNAELYSESELSAFFAKDSFHSLNEIQAHFPITYFRCESVLNNTMESVPSSDSSYYIVFPVREGGNYLVFLWARLNRDQYELCSSDAYYVYNLPDESDFSTLKTDISFFELQEKYPCTWLVSTASSYVSSYSPTHNRSIVRCNWKLKNDEYILESWEKESGDFLHENYSEIFLKDLFLYE